MVRAAAAVATVDSIIGAEFEANKLPAENGATNGSDENEVAAKSRPKFPVPAVVVAMVGAVMAPVAPECIDESNDANDKDDDAAKSGPKFPAAAVVVVEVGAVMVAFKV